MSEPFSSDEDRAANVKAKRVVFKRSSVAFPHEKVDKTLVSFVEFDSSLSKRHPRRVHNREVVREGAVEVDESWIVERRGHSDLRAISLRSAPSSS